MRQKKGAGIGRAALKRALKLAMDLGRKATSFDIERLKRQKDRMKRGPLRRIWDKVVFLWNAWNEADLPMQTRVLIIGSLLYMVLPLDVIPDAIMPVGLLDDAAVIIAVYKLVSDKLQAIKEAARAGIKIAGQAAREGIQIIRQSAHARVTEETAARAEAAIRKSLAVYTKRLAIRLGVRFFIFCTALVILYIFPRNNDVAIGIASVLIASLALWSIVGGIIWLCSFIPLLCRTIKQYRKTPRYDKKGRPYSVINRLCEAAAQVYAARRRSKAEKKGGFEFFIEKYKLAASVRLLSFLNSGVLGAWMPDGKTIMRELAERLKRLMIFYGCCALAYGLVYMIIVRSIVLRSVTDYSLWELCLWPFMIACDTLFSTSLTW